MEVKMPTMKRRRRYGSGHVTLRGGPYDGRRISGFIARGWLECEGGVYAHALPLPDEQVLVWVENPLTLYLAQGTAWPSVVE